MADRGQLLQAVHAAHATGSGADIAKAAAALQAFDAEHAAGLAQQRETDLGAHLASRALTPVPVHELHTAATDWIGEVPDPDTSGVHTAMTAEATLWMRQLDPAVLADREEFSAQAQGRAATLASAYGSLAREASKAFLDNVAYLASTRTAASGLPQIDQLIDPNNQPAPTPYPAAPGDQNQGVFENFAPWQNEYNGGVESQDHQSQISSEQAPQIQQIEQQDSSGSGFGGGPEKPDEHTTSFDTSNSYAEVPLGPPGTIPTAPAATDSAQGGSAQPTPGFGQDQDEGDERRPTTRKQSSQRSQRFIIAEGTLRSLAKDWTEEERASARFSLGPEHKEPINNEHDLEAARIRAHQVKGIPQSEVQSYLDRAAQGLHAARLQATAAVPGYTRRDAQGFSWRTAALAGPEDSRTPHHLACGGWHYPTEDCRQRMAHTASAAVDHSMTMDQFTARSRYEEAGTQYAQGVIRQAGGDLRRIAAHHDQQIASFQARADGNPEEIAWLNGYLATIRPALAEPPGDFSQAAGPGHGQPRSASMAKGAPFAGYKDFAACVAANQDKNDPEAYCGKIKHQVEGASSLPQVQQVTDPNNVPTPEADQLPADTMFPIDPAFAQQWETGPQGAQPRGGDQHEAARMNGLPTRAAEMFGGMDALEGKGPRHQNDWAYSAKAHGKYLGAWNTNRAFMNTAGNKTPMTKQEYAEQTGRPDMYQHYIDMHEQSRRMRMTGALDSYLANGSPMSDSRPAETMPDGQQVGDQDGDQWGGQAEPGQEEPYTTASRRHTADTLTKPHQTTDDTNPPYNSPQTTPQPAQSPPGQGFSDGVTDAQAGEAPTFTDNSSHVSPYVQQYSQGYASVGTDPGAQPGQPDVPGSMGGDSGQAQNAQQAQQQFMVSKGSRRGLTVSAAFVPREATADPEFRKGYRFAASWQPHQQLVSPGSGSFEAGLYAGMTDNPRYQASWVSRHRVAAAKNPGLAQRLELHGSFTRKWAAEHEDASVKGLYVQAATTTDLITDGPGTSPDPMGATPLNGPGQPPPMGGLSDPAQPGGPSPYQGAEPTGHGPVAPDDVVGEPQEAPQPQGPIGQGFSGPGPGYTNQNLAPRGPNTAAGNGYSNPAAYKGSPGGPDRVATLVRTSAKALAFRGHMQARLELLRGAQK